MMTPVLIFEEMRMEMELLAAILVFLIPFARKKKNFVIWSCICFVLLVAAALLFFPIFHSKENPDHIILLGFWYLFFSVAPIFYSKFCFVISWCDSIFMTISAFAIQNIVYVSIHQLLARYFYQGLRNHLILYIFISIGYCFILYGLIYKVFAKKLAECEGKLFDDTIQNILFYCFMFLLMLFTLFHYQELFKDYPSNFMLQTCFLGIIFCIFLLSIEYSMFRSRSHYKENAKLEQFLHNNTKYYEMSKESIEIINRKCHDLKHQLKVLSQVSDKERNAYIEEAQKDIMFYQQLVHSNNDVINTILAEKGLFCSEHDISLSCSVDNVNLNFIHVADLYAILGNGIDNAIEYVDQFEEPEMRVINFRISQKKQFVSIQINNPYLGPDLGHALPLTNKHNMAEHGFGLKSIKYLTEKYHGWMEIGTSDKLFTLQLMLPLQR
ncbi:MAG: ATP-binding protein [Lachnotalea sp.]